MSLGTGGSCKSQRTLPQDRFLGVTQRHEQIALSIPANAPDIEGAAFQVTLALLEPGLHTPAEIARHTVRLAIDRYCNEFHRHEVVALKLRRPPFQIPHEHSEPAGDMVSPPPPSSLSLDPPKPTAVPIPTPRKRDLDQAFRFGPDADDVDDPQYDDARKLM